MLNVSKASDVRMLLGQLGIRPDRNLGQNFLVDDNVRQLIVSLAQVQPGERLLEIGPGLGVLTEGLLRAGGEVIAIEKDARLAAFLADRHSHDQRLAIVNADALAVDMTAILAGADASCAGRLAPRPVDRVIANLPYSVGSRILMEIFIARCRPQAVVVTVQKEVADRLAAPPGSSQYGLLSVWGQRVFDIWIDRSVHPRCFWPVPEVTSAIVVMHGTTAHELDRPAERFFRDITRLAFSHRRKQMKAILSRWPELRDKGDVGELLAGASVVGTARPESLTVEDWCRLALCLAGYSR